MKFASRSACADARLVPPRSVARVGSRPAGFMIGHFIRSSDSGVAARSIRAVRPSDDAVRRLALEGSPDGALKCPSP